MDFERAIADDNEAIRLDPKSAEGYILRAATYMVNAKLDECIADDAEAIRLKPSPKRLAHAYGNREFAYSLEHEWDKAISDCTEAIRLDPTSFWAFGVRGHAYQEKGEPIKAKKDLDEEKRLRAKLK